MQLLTISILPALSFFLFFIFIIIIIIFFIEGITEQGPLIKSRMYI